MQIQTNPQSRFRVTFEIHFGPHSVEGPHFFDDVLSFFGAGAKIVDWSPFSLAQRRIASREREKVILIWGQTSCLNLHRLKVLPPKKSCQLDFSRKLHFAARCDFQQQVVFLIFCVSRTTKIPQTTLNLEYFL